MWPFKSKLDKLSAQAKKEWEWRELGRMEGKKEAYDEMAHKKKEPDEAV